MKTKTCIVSQVCLCAHFWECVCVWHFVCLRTLTPPLMLSNTLLRSRIPSHASKPVRHTHACTHTCAHACTHTHSHFYHSSVYYHTFVFYLKFVRKTWTSKFSIDNLHLVLHHPLTNSTTSSTHTGHPEPPHPPPRTSTFLLYPPPASYIQLHPWPETEPHFTFTLICT